MVRRGEPFDYHDKIATLQRVAVMEPSARDQGEILKRVSIFPPITQLKGEGRFYTIV
jgi:hypothetical protein